MNSYERYMAVVKGKPCDILPRVPILMRLAAEYIGSNYGAFASDYRVLVESNLRCAEDFGMDQVSAISDPYRETQGFGAEIVYVRDGVPRCKKHPLEDTKDLRALAKPDPLKSERMLDRVQAVRAFKERAGGRYSILGWIEGPAAEAGDLRTVMNFMTDLLEDEPFVCELMDLCVEVGIAFARAQVEAGADTIGVGDAVASQVSPDVYERLIQPREKRLVKAIQDMGALVRMHICGNITHLLPGLADIRPEILDVDWMVDLERVRKAMGAGIVLAGNIDPAAAVRFSTPDKIRAAIRDCRRRAGNPFMVNAGCEIPAGTPYENLKALCEPVAMELH
ncbi:MAG: uroporphyrinogen decarboxylase family protein [Candidatus Sumerlaeota bacterium]|nr:uroporphyrinogen decarboxylase family protein [Candidatus Sumerlaeota bacterium]